MSHADGLTQVSNMNFPRLKKLQLVPLLLLWLV
jgi:hypothetical protein